MKTGICIFCAIMMATLSNNTLNAQQPLEHRPQSMESPGKQSSEQGTRPGQGARPGQGSQRLGQGSQRPGQGSQRPEQGSQRPGQGSQRPGQGSQRPGGGASASSIKYTAVRLYNGKTFEGAVNLNDLELESTLTDQSALRADSGATVIITGLDASKPSGNVSNEEASNFYALGAVIAAAGASDISINSGKVESNAKGANAFFAYGNGSRIEVSNVEIRTKANSSRGLFASYGGTVIGNNLTINTDGAHCAGLATDRGGGLVKASNTRGTMKGQGSPCIYSTGDIVVTDCNMESLGSEAIVIEGKNTATVTDSHLKGCKRCGAMLYQSMSGDASQGMSVLTMTGSTLEAQTGPSFFITNTKSEIHLSNTALISNTGCILEAGSDRWGRDGSNGGQVKLTASNQKLEGSFKANAISRVEVILMADATLTGCLDAEHQAEEMRMTMNEGSQWTLTATSYLSSLEFDCPIKQGVKRIKGCGFDIYYNKQDPRSAALESKTYNLSGGGRLIPM